MADALFSLPAGLPADPALLATLLDLLPMGVIYYTPVVDAAGALTDLALTYLNPAAQRMTQLPARPATTYRQQFPTTDANGAWDFHRRSWLAREPQQFQFYYDADGFDNYFRVTAQRLGDGLLAIFTDTQDEVRSQVEQALLASQARERVAHTVAEAERQRFHDVLMQLPAQVAINRGPDHVFTLVNGPYQQMFPTRPIQGLPVRQALPELEGQQFYDLLDRVYQTGEPFYSRAMPAEVDFTNTGLMEQRYVDVFFQALHDAQGRVDGILNFSYDVTEQVLARQQVEQLNAGLEARVTERTQEAERQRQSVVELVAQAPAAMCVVAGPEFRYETFNPLYAAMFGGRPQLGRPMGEVLPEVVNHPSFLAFRAVYEQGRTIRQNEVLVPLARPDDGVLEDHYFSYTQQPRYDSQGQIDGVFVFAVEVTEQVLARQQVEQLNQELEARVAERTHQVEIARAEAERERAQLHALLAQAPVAIALFAGPDLRFAAVNPEMAALWSSTPAHVLGRPLLEALPNLQGQGFDDLLRQVMQTQVPVTGKETPAVLLREGRPHTGYYNFVYQPFYDADGQVAGVLDVAQDVTEQVLARRQVEQLNQALEARVQQRTQELAQQQRLLNQILRQVPAAVATFSAPDHRFTFFNERYQQLVTGRAQVGRSAAEALPEVAAQGFMALLDGIYTTGQPYKGVESLVELTSQLTGQTERYYFDSLYQPLTDAQGQTQGVLVFATEVSEKVLARQQVQDLNTQLAAANAALTARNEELGESNRRLTRTNVDLDTFVYTASHDLKAPITNIESIVLALRDTLPSDVQQDELVTHLFDLLDKTTARFQFTIAQLTDLTKLQLAHAGLAEPVCLAEVVELVRLDLAPVIAAAEARLRVEVAPELVVSFSPANLRSTLYNLLSNAVKYRAFDRPAQVHVRAARTPQGVVLTVADNGLGLNEHQQGRLFGLFQRLHDHVEGTGVGLYITKRLVENGGGSIAVQSAPNVGTTFTVTLPA